MGWKVVATQPGQFNQVFRETGEVFDLMTYPDGTYPVFIEYTPKKTKDGKLIEDEYVEKVIKTRTLDGKSEEPAHRDFAEDKGNIKIKRGPKKGEVMRFGWMRRVPDNIPVGLYPVNPDTQAVCDFWNNFQLPQPYQRPYVPEDTRRPHAVMKNPRGGHLDKATEEPDDEDEEEAA